MKNFCLFILLCILASCQEVITLNLNSIQPKLVVEGYVDNSTGPYLIKLSTTTNYFDPSGVKPLSGAKVAISDNAGNSDTLIEKSPGIYSTSTLTTVLKRSYYLFVNANGKKYTAAAMLTDTVPQDSLSYQLRMPRPGTTGLPSYVLTCSFTDPATLGNYYGFCLYRNSVLKNDIVDNRVVEDKFINGNAQHARLRNGDLIPGDSVQVDFISFDKSAYDYYNTLRSTLSTGSPFSAPPANPATNISNGGLGYFGAYAISRRKIVLH
jgi:hypothetical protein